MDPRRIFFTLFNKRMMKNCEKRISSKQALVMNVSVFAHQIVLCYEKQTLNT